MIERVRRGIVADAVLASGATILLLLSTSASAWSLALTVAGALLVVLGLALLWGVPRPSFRLRMLSSVPGLLFGYAVVSVGSPSALAAAGFGILLLAALLHRARVPER